MRLLMSAIVMVAAPLGARPLTSQEQAQMQANMTRGDLLYAYDQAAWHVTDAMAAALSPDTKKLLRGFIVTPDGDHFRATFYGKEDDREFAIYSATWNGNEIVHPVVHSSPPFPSITPEEHRLISARNIALNVNVIDSLFFCKDGTPNVAVVPGPKVTDPISVYLMTPQTDLKSWPLGGHHRIDVKDGKILSQRAFTKSCIELGGAPSKDEVLSLMSISHSLDPVPTEIHAFTVHTSGTAVQVITEDSAFVLGRREGKIVVEQDR